MSCDSEDGFVHSLARGLSVFRAFGPGRERLTIAQVASEAGLTRAGARRLLLTLRELGYVGVDGRHFFMTSRVLDLSRGFVEQSLWDKVRPALAMIASTLNETVSAAVLEGADVVYTLRVRSPRLIHLDLNVGAHLPAYASAMGRVLLATWREGELDRYLKQGKFERYTQNTVIDPTELRKRIEEAREQGFCAARDEIIEGVTCIAVPLRDLDGNMLAALSVSMATPRATAQAIRNKVVPALRGASAGVSGALEAAH
jgi:IclR family pca regulon transcriptional regulator